MPNSKLLALLCNGFLLAAPLVCQIPKRDCSQIKQTPTEALIQRDEPLCRYIAHAPSCERIPKLHADTIFIGTVVKLAKADGLQVVNGECSNVSVETATVHVKESFTGAVPNIVTIQSGTVNGYYFQLHESALIFANRNPDGTFSVSFCGGTTSLTEFYTHGQRENPVAKEDIAYLRSRSSLPPTGRIFGSVWVSLPDTGRMVLASLGFKDQTINVLGPQSLQTKTSESGEFSVNDLRPGKYSVRVDTSKSVNPDHDQEIEIQPGSCAQIYFTIESADDYHDALKSIRKANTKHQ